MTDIEMIEELRKNADISYQTASEVLEGVNWNIDAARTALKKEGLYRKEETYMMTTENFTKNSDNTGRKTEKVSRFFSNAVHWAGDKLRRGMHNDFVIESKSGRRFSVPVTIAVILLITCIEIVPLVLLAAFFCGCRFSFSGSDLGTEKINQEMANIHYTYENS